ncbi:helix-turn-helix domain-containing protein [Nonomuraea sp. K274]|uniref:Helix-turn-helix domain-containing protein n=1 Tax=Nonomuraea cypriaca TaxID=1187855 RepID=A0A931F0Z7_9ACTN|nr:helix-turn-helix transcriptional regulator [Nonomuraea cypriaca]MBF8187671.1 helix-turn-helix domain-containing protein [Nonomuraea cypriaca]
MIDRAGLADFLRRRRELLRPSDVGLPDGVRRRTPGLRRDEVAQLAGMSSDYYARLEQCRGANPSEPIVASLARALRCDLDERDHLFHLAGLTPPARRAGRHIRPGLISLVDRLTDVPAGICTDLGEVLWQNALADIVLGRQDHHADGRARNLAWRWFTDPASRARIPEEDWPRHSAAHVNDLRATYSRRAGDNDVVELVQGLRERSAEFRASWERHEVGVRRFDRKRLLHPEAGVLHLTCEVLLTPEEDLRVIAFFPTEGTDAREKLDLLRVIGTQNFQSEVAAAPGGRTRGRLNDSRILPSQPPASGSRSAASGLVE